LKWYQQQHQDQAKELNRLESLHNKEIDRHAAAESQIHAEKIKLQRELADLGMHLEETVESSKSKLSSVMETHREELEDKTKTMEKLREEIENMAREEVSLNLRVEDLLSDKQSLEKKIAMQLTDVDLREQQFMEREKVSDEKISIQLETIATLEGEKGECEAALATAREHLESVKAEAEYTQSKMDVLSESHASCQAELSKHTMQDRLKTP